MVKVVMIDKHCKLKKTNIKNFDTKLLYKKCNLRQDKDFSKRYSWKLDDVKYVSLFCKDNGRAGNEK